VTRIAQVPAPREEAPAPPAIALITAPPVARHGRVRSLVEALRPRQWVKNVLVAAAPLAAARQLDTGVVLATLLAFGVFTAASAGTYLFNDVRDRASDALHPDKRHRPVARGDVPVRLAVTCAAVLLTCSVVVPALTGHLQLAACMAVYVGLMQAYSLGLKDEPVIDMAIVASGFLLRAMAGGLAAGLPLSKWFLIVSAFGSLFMVSGKRYSELVALGPDAGGVRAALDGYTTTYLRFVWGMSAGVLLTAYCLWAFEVGTAVPGGTTAPWSALSVAPFLLAVLRYALDVDRGLAAAPEDIALNDRALQLIALCWLVTFGLGAAGV
jgi:decaprenyl-phosphate phosphoribosyltransferase